MTDDFVSLEKAIEQMIDKDAKKMGGNLYYWQDVRKILKMVGDRAEKTRQIFAECFLDSYGETSNIYRDDLEEKVLGLWAAQKEV